MANQGFRSVATLVWVVLVIATVASWWLSRGQAAAPAETVSIVMVIAAVKARLIILHFMGLKHAPLPLRLIFEGWAVAVTGFILVGTVFGNRFI
jgi:caa(3)-type oxidase subunit IV